MNTEVTGFSHVAIGVTDLDRSIAFYRDILGLKVTLKAEEVGDGVVPFHREAAYMRWRDGPAESFIVLDRHFDRAPFGEPAKIFQIGYHHIAFSVSDIDAVLSRARDAGAEIVSDATSVNGRAYGYVEGGDKPMVRTAFLRDPDGNFVQLDQWLTQQQS